jgi:hypothetical protein
MVDLGFMSPGDDPGPLVAMIHIVCEPLERDAPFDPREFDIVERAGRVAQLALAHRIFKAPAHQVFLMRALLGTDAYLKAFGTVRNWHRVFQGIVDAIPAAPDEPRATPA